MTAYGFTDTLPGPVWSAIRKSSRNPVFRPIRATSEQQFQERAIEAALFPLQPIRSSTECYR